MKKTKIAFIVVLLVSFIQAKTGIKKFNNTQEAVFEFLADDMEYSESEVIGRGNAVVINLDYFLTADKAIYNTQTNEIVLLGNVNAYKGNALYLKSSHIKIKVQEDYSFLEPFYLQESESGLWVSADSAEFNNNVYQAQGAVVSTCSVNNPIWQLKASKGEYDVNEEWLRVWNPRLCIYEVPILYLPYLSFSAGYKRKTGLLYPLIGSSNDDGIMYSQPIFIAPDSWWDMTLSPQVRTKRGGGVFSEARMIDDKNEMLWANFGAFANTGSYRRKYDLENQTHYGFQTEYKRKDLLTHKQDFFKEDGLYLDITQVSDIDYLRLQEEKTRNKADLQGSLLTSRLNYFLKSENDYIGLYGRYYNDLEYTSNARTLQTLPEVQYHHQIGSLFVDNLYYSFDYKVANYTRAKGYRAVQQEATLPIIFTQPLFDDYLNATISPIFYATNVDYYNTKEVRLEDGRYFSNYYSFKLNSDLVKQYSDFGHTLNLESEYILPGIKEDRGDFETFFTLPGDYKELRLGLTQAFFDLENDLKLSHRIYQPVFFGGDLNQYGEIENDIQYFYDYHWSFLSNIFYSHQRQRISEATHQLRYDSDDFGFFVGHFMREDFAHQEILKGRFGEANYLNAGFNSDFDYFTLFASVGYDYKERDLKTWQVGVDTTIRCFSFGIKYVSEVYPTLTRRGAEAKDDKYVLLTIKFIPLLSSDVKINN